MPRILQKGERITAAHYAAVTEGASRKIAGDGITSSLGNVSHTQINKDYAKLFELTALPELFDNGATTDEVYSATAKARGLGSDGQFVTVDEPEYRVYFPLLGDQDVTVLEVGSEVMGHWSPSLYRWSSSYKISDTGGRQIRLKNMTGIAKKKGDVLGVGTPVEETKTWAPSTNFTVGDSVFYNGTFYTCNTTHLSTGSFDSGKFDVDSDPAFLRGRTYEGNSVVQTTHGMDRWAVLTQDCQATKTAEAVIYGHAVAKINITDTSATHADINSSDQLGGLFYGWAKIIWKEGGTGQRWCKLFLGHHNYKVRGVITVATTGASHTGTLTVYAPSGAASSHTVSVENSTYGEDLGVATKAHASWYPAIRKWVIEGASCPP